MAANQGWLSIVVNSPPIILKRGLRAFWPHWNSSSGGKEGLFPIGEREECLGGGRKDRTQYLTKAGLTSHPF
jgi:hypothetical protein